MLWQALYPQDGVFLSISSSLTNPMAFVIIQKFSHLRSMLGKINNMRHFKNILQDQIQTICSTWRPTNMCIFLIQQSLAALKLLPLLVIRCVTL